MAGVDTLSMFSEIALEWMPLNPTDDTSVLV